MWKALTVPSQLLQDRPSPPPAPSATATPPLNLNPDPNLNPDLIPSPQPNQQYSQQRQQQQSSLATRWSDLEARLAGLEAAAGCSGLAWATAVTARRDKALDQARCRAACYLPLPDQALPLPDQALPQQAHAAQQPGLHPTSTPPAPPQVLPETHLMPSAPSSTLPGTHHALPEHCLALPETHLLLPEPSLVSSETDPVPPAPCLVLTVRPALSLQGHEGSIFGVQWADGGRRLITTSDDRSARVWQLPE